jgi:hypothetical protein
MSSINSVGSMNAGMMQGMHHAHHKPNAGALASDVFSKLDPTGQGSIDSQSFLAALGSQTQSQSSPVTSEDASKFFSAMDGNADGKVTQEEMTAMFQKVSDQFQTRMQTQQQQGGMPSPPPLPESSTASQAADASSNPQDQALDALMKALQNNTASTATAANSTTTAATTTAATTAPSSVEQLQKQLSSMIRRYEQMANTALTNSATASATKINLAV